MSMLRALRADSGVAEAAVLLRDGLRVAYVVPEGPFDPRAIAGRLRDDLVPDAWTPIGALPRTAGGRIDVAALGGLEVLDDDVVARAEQTLSQQAGVRGAAAMIVPRALPTPGRVHLGSTASAAETPSEEESSVVEREQPIASSDVPSLVHGGDPELDDHPSHLGGLLLRAAVRAPQKGVRYLRNDGDEEFQTYPELLQQAQAVLSGLQYLGLRPGDQLLLQLNDRRSFLTALWGCFLGGVVPVPAATDARLDPSSSAAARLANAWTLLGGPPVLCDHGRAEALDELAEAFDLEGLQAIEIGDLEGMGSPANLQEPDRDALALLLMTSGSTGKPKLVRHTHHSLLARESGAVRATGWKEDEVSLNWLTLDHVASLVDFHLRDVFLGCDQIQGTAEQVLEEPLRWLDWIDRCRVTVTWAPNFAYALLADRLEETDDERSWDLSCLRCTLNGGEAIVARAARRCIEALAPYGYGADVMQPVWGMSETGSGATYSHLTLENTRDDDAFVDLGRPIPGISLRVVDDEQQVVGEGAIGHLQVQGHTVTPGYHLRPELNDEVFTYDGWFRTGDLAFLRDGRLFITGRAGDVIIVNGLNYYCHEIESVVEETPGVQASFTAACAVRTAGSETDELAIFCCTPARSEEARRDLIRDVRRKVLTDVGLFAEHVLLLEHEQIPKTAIGKIQRSRLVGDFDAGELDAARRESERLTGRGETLPHWFHHRVWTPCALENEEREQTRKLLILLDRGPLGRELNADPRIEAVLGVAGLSFQRQDDHWDDLRDSLYVVDPAHPERLIDTLSEDGHEIDGLVFFWSWGQQPVVPDRIAGAVFLKLVRTLNEGPWPHQNGVDLWWVTNHSQAFDASESPVPDRGLLPALIQTARRELPWLRVRHVDLDRPDADLVAAEIFSSRDDAEVVWRDGERYVPRLETIDFEEANEEQGVEFVRDGVYLLIGGMGGIGRLLIQDLLTQGARVLATGRGDLDEERAAELERLRGAADDPASIEYLGVDPQDVDAFVYAVEKILEKWNGRLDGVVHLAADFREAALLDERRRTLELALAPKGLGALAITRLLEKHDETFVLAFSSVNSYFGGAGVGVYAAANRAMESFCADLRALGRRAYCYAWSMWDEVGMSRGYALKDLSRARGFSVIDPHEALASLRLAMASGRQEMLIGLDAGNPQIAAQIHDLPLRALRGVRVFVEGEPAALLLKDRFGVEVDAAIEIVDALPRTDDDEIDREALASWALLGDEDAAAPRSPLEKRLAALFAEVLATPQVGLNEHFFQLGGHSILATRLLGRLREDLDVDLPMARFLAGPTVGELAEMLADSSVGAGPGVSASDDAEEASEAGVGRSAFADLKIEPDASLRFAPFPMTEIQQAYWIGASSELELGGVGMHFYQELDADDLDRERLEETWNVLLKRHDMLRAVISPSSGEVQIQVETPRYEIRESDLRDAAPVMLQKVLSKVRKDLSHRSYSLDRWPWFEIFVTHLPGGVSRIHLSFSVVHLDGGSLFLLMSEWSRLYQDPSTVLPDIELNYRDYALALKELEETDDYRRALAWWRDRIPSLPAAPTLPLAQQWNSSIKTHRFEHRSYDIAPATWRRIERLARKMGVSRSATLLTAYAAVLHAWGAGRSSLLNVTLFNRLPLHPQIHDIIGDFTSMVLLEAVHDPADTFETLARRLQERLWTDLEYRQVSGVTVARELARELDEHGTALTPVVFTSALDLEMGGVNSPSEAMSGLGRNVYHISQTPQVLLDFQLFREGDGVRMIWDSVVGAFPEGMLDDMFGALSRLVDDLALEETWKSRPRLIPLVQLQQRREVNATDAPISDLLLHELFSRRVREQPHRLAVLAVDRDLTFGELDLRSRRLGAWLRARGARPNQLVAVVMHKGWQQIAAVLGILHSGAAYVPVDAGLPKERRFLILESSEASLILTQEHLLDSIEWPDGPTVLAIDAEPDPELHPELVDDDPPPFERLQEVTDLAYVIFTSGSTGTPKGVVIDHRGAVNTMLDINERYDVGPEDRTLALSSLSFDLSVYDVFGMLGAGGGIVVPDAKGLHDPQHWMQRVWDGGVTLWNSVPALLEIAVDFTERGRESFPEALRVVMLSGDWIPVGLPDRLRALASGAEVWSLGGATEASVWSILFPIDEVPKDWRSIPYGKPMVNQRFYVLDEAHDPCPIWVHGDLFIGGIGVAVGYWKDPEKTSASFYPNPHTGERIYRTGDLGRYLPDGNIEFLGRADTQVKVRGHRIELGEIEAHLDQHPSTVTSVVLPVGDNPQEKRLVAWVTPAPEQRPDAAELRAHLEAHLPHYMVPVSIAVLDALPLTPIGKVDRGRLARTLPGIVQSEAANEEKEFVAGRNPIEMQLADLWAELLKAEKVSVYDDLLHLGGNSLMAIIAITRIRELFGVGLPLRLLLGGHPTVASLAAVIREKTEGTDDTQGDTFEALPIIRANPEERYEPFPLHAIQEAYWIGRRDAFELGNVAAYFYLEVEVPKLDVERFREAWQKVIDRHDMLRAIIDPDGRQRVLEETPPYDVAVLDLRGRRPVDAEKELLAIRDRMADQVLDPSSWPLFELRASRLASGMTRLHFGLDLLIADAWSVQIIFRDLEIFYRGDDRDLLKLKLTYRDYLFAEKELESSETYRKAQEYWWRKLDTLPSAPQLPLVKEVAAIRKPVFVRRRAVLEKEVWDRLRAQAVRRGVTPSTMLATAFGEVLGAWSSTPRFTLNITTFNRLAMHPQVDEVVGDFTSSTLVVMDRRGAPTFLRRVEQLQNELWEGLEHRHVSGVKVLRELARRQERTPGALAPIVFTSLLARYGESDENTAFLPLGGELVFAGSQTPQVWLDHQVIELDGGLAFTWDVVEELLPEGLLDDLFNAYVALLRRLADDHSSWETAHLDLLPDSHRRTRDRVNQTVQELPHATLDRLFVERLNLQEEQKEQVAVITDERTLTYEELDRYRRAIADWLHDQGTQLDHLVAVVMDKGWEQIAAVLGIHGARAAYLPIAPDWPAGRRDYLLESGRVDLVLTQSKYELEFDWPDGVEVLAVDEIDLDRAYVPLEAPARTNLSDLAYVIFTSGSTGLPKGVMIDHRGAANTVIDINRRYRVGPKDRTFALSALNFDLSVYDVFGLLAAGGAIVVPSSETLRDPGRWLEMLREHEVSVWNSVPALMEMLVEYATPRGEKLPDSLRVVMLSGDWIPVSLPDRLRALAPNAKVISLGGATEASIWSIYYSINEVPAHWTSIPYGRPLDNQTFHVLDDALLPCPTWVPGDLYIGGIGVALGYWRDERKTNASFVVHPRNGARIYRTGDMGRYLPDGNIEFLGRNDLQVKIQGHRIELGEIEAVLQEHPLLNHAVAVVAGARTPSQRLVAFYLSEANEEVDVDALRDLAASKLAPYMVPSTFHPLDQLPLTSNGKVDRQALERLTEQFSETEEGERERVLPRGPVQTGLAEVWSELLRLGEIGVHDNLFTLGGNSLLAIQAATKIRGKLGVELPLRAILGDPTIAGMAREVEALLAAADPGEDVLPTVTPDPEHRNEPFPLNEIQEAYWLGRLDAFEMGNIAAHYYVELDYDDLDLARFERAWQRVVERHDMLRVVIPKDGQGHQIILAEVPAYEMKTHDLRERSAEDVDAFMSEIRDEMSHQVLTTDEWPLFDIRASRLKGEGGDVVRVHFSLDLLLADAWSSQIFFHDLERFYVDPERELEALELSFRDFLLTDRSLADSPQYARSRIYWDERLETLPNAPQLPLARDPGSIDDPVFVRRGTMLAPDVWNRLSGRAPDFGMTPSGLLLSIFSEVLAKWSEEPRFTLNVTTFRRLPLHEQVEHIVGDFTSLTLLAVDSQAGDTFAERGKSLQEQLWTDLEHRYVGGISLLRKLTALRGEAPGSSPMPIVFTSLLANYQTEDDSAADALDGRLNYAISQTPQVWLDHQVSLKEDGSLEINWDVVEELFPPGMIDAMFGAFCGLLHQLADDAEAWDVERFDLVPPAQLELRAKMNATEEDVLGDRDETLLHTLFAAQAEKTPERLAVAADDRTLTYAELLSASRRLGRFLRDRGAKPESLVAVFLPKNASQIVATFAVLESGAAYLPLSAEWPAERLGHLLEHGQVRLVLTNKELRDSIAWPEDRDLMFIDVDGLAYEPSLSDKPLPIVTRGDQLAYVIFTSGSTGKPKGVAIEHHAAVNTVLDINQRFGVGEDDRTFAISALNFDLSVYDLFGLLAIGGAVVVPAGDSERNPESWLRSLEEHGVTLWNSVPALLEMLVEYAEAQDRRLPEALRLAMLSGDWIPVSLPGRAWKQLPDLRVISLGGATEASIWSIYFPIDAVDPAWKSIPYGRPLANQTFHVLDRHFLPSPEWAPGELYIGGVGVARCYYRDEERTSAQFFENPHTGERIYRTGDHGRYLPSGDIEFLGRLDFQVKVRGYRIELGEIEAALEEHPNVRGAAALVVGSTNADRRIVAFVVGLRVPTEEQMRTWLESKIPSYMVPSSLRGLDAFPLSATGKVDRKALMKLAEDAASIDEYVAPRGHDEQQLAEIWQGILGLERIGAHDNLFTLGGNSLLAIQAAARMKDVFGVDVPLRTVLGDPTIAGMATQIGRILEEQVFGEAELTLPHLEPDPDSRFEPFPLNEIQQAYWVGRLDAFELGNVAAHYYVEQDTRGLDLGRFEYAWQRVVERHDMLRAIIRPDGLQVILEEVPPYEIRTIDLRGRPAEEVEAKIQEIRAEMSHQVHDPSTWPLFELRAVLTEDDDGEIVRMHISLDLLIADAWSSQIFFHDVERFYSDPTLVLEPFALSFRDYLLADRMLADSMLYQRANRYWAQRLDQLPAAPQLPLACDPSSIGTPVFVRRHTRLEADLWERLGGLATDHGMTPSGFLLNAFAEVLARWSKEPRFTLNVTTFRRLPLHEQIDHIVGDFTSLTLLAIDASSAHDFEGRGRNLQEQLWSDLEHRYVSGISVLRRLGAQRGEAPGGVVMPIVFTSLLARYEEESGTRALEGDPDYAISQTPQVWLDHQVSLKQDGSLEINWDVVEDLFPPGMIDAMYDAFIGLLRRLAEEPELWRAQRLDLLPEEQTARRVAVNETGTGPEEAGEGLLLHTLFTERAAETPERPAVIAERTLSYGELASAARRIGRVLRDRGAAPETLVAIVLPKGWEQIVAAFAVLESGAAYLPLDASLPAERLEYLLERGRVEHVLTSAALRASLEWPAEQSLSFIDVESASFDESLDDAPLATVASPDQLAYVIFTSGSTGKPKGVAIEHRGAINTILDINRRFDVGPDDRTFAISALNFDLSVYDLFGLLAVGGAVVVPASDSERNPESWLRSLREHDVTLWNSVPALLEMLVEYVEGQGDDRLPEGLRVALLSGDWIPLSLPDRFRARSNSQVISLGGATEASIWSIFFPIDEVEEGWKSIPYGRPLANQTFHVLDARGEPAPEWVPGELFIGGDGLARCYWRDPQKTALSFAVDPESRERLYRTGDYGRYLPTGDIEFLGREDTQVKVAGYRIELGEIEAALSEHPEIGSAVVTAPPVPGAERQRRLIGYVITGQGRPDDEDAGEGEIIVDPVVDPLARLQFKLERRGVRRDLDQHSAVALPGGGNEAEVDEALLRTFAARRSHRRFLSEPIPANDFAALLGALRQIQPGDLPLPKYRYPSGGGLYPVQVYVVLREDAVEGVAGGIYYYHPEAHRLDFVADAQIPDDVHGPENRPIAAGASFTLLLVGKMGAIGPMYPKTADEFALMEAGYMSQLLMEEAPSARLGLCPLGGLRFEEVRPHLDLASEDRLLHVFVGGRIEASTGDLLAALSEEHSPPPNVDPKTQAEPDDAKAMKAEAIRDKLSEGGDGTAEAVDWGARAITDPLERLEFKTAKHGLRRPPGEAQQIALSGDVDDDVIATFASRASRRRFLSDAVPLQDLSDWLGCLRSVQPEGVPLPKYRYPSGGGLYPMQTYLHVKDDRVDGLAGGTYYHDPVEHRLILLEEGVDLPTELHAPVNQGIAESSALTLFLVADLEAVAPLYPGMALDFCYLEAGYMGQLLMEQGAAHRLGLCPLGGLDFGAVRPHLALGGRHRLIHLFSVGAVPAVAATLEDAVREQQELASTPSSAEESSEKQAAVRVSGRLDADALKTWLGEKIPHYMVPPNLIFLDRLPLTANGKVDRRALPLPEDLAAAAPSRPAEEVAPRSDLERRLADLVRAQLDIERVGIYDNLFEIGATSVQIIQLQRKIREELEVEIPLTEIFRQANVAALASALGDAEPTADVVEEGQKQAQRRKKAGRRRRKRRGDRG